MKIKVFLALISIPLFGMSQDSYPVTQIGDTAKIFIANSRVVQPQKNYTVSNSVATIYSLVGTLDEYTTDIRINVARGGDLCVTLDGKTAPVGGSVGEVWYGGAIFTVRKEQAAKLKFIREGASNSQVSITQLQTQGVKY